MNHFDYNQVKDLLVKYKAKLSDKFSPQQKDLVEELRNSLGDLDKISTEIVNLTSELFANEKIIPNENDEIEIMGMKLKLKRADPNIPIQIDNASKGYLRGHTDSVSDTKTKERQNKLERATAEFYRVAHRAAHIIANLPGLESFKATSIRIVRNQLIEHPETSGITHDSFLYSKNEGPYVKGLRIGDQTAHRDKGFKANSEEFLNELTKIFNQALN